MPSSYVGEISALLVSVCWAISSSSFEKSCRRVGSLSVNYIRLFLAFIMLGIIGLFSHGSFFPTGAEKQQWIWLSVSGLLGFFMGDLLSFKSLSLIGSRLSMLVMTFSPVITALISFFILNERLRFYQILAILLITFGILMAFIGFEKNQVKFRISLKGFLFALGGALGQSLGLIFSKKGIGHYDPFAATQIRIITGFLAFSVLILFLKRTPSVKKTLKDAVSMKFITIGSFFGPGLGVALSLFAVTKTETGVASTLMALPPILLIIPALIKGKPVAKRELIGAFISVGGVIILFL
ncbi:MAG: DMT family transporter [Bacteroidota bacterium]|nr:DMT family transporter [Bacteroidota bacterium]